MFAQMIPVIKNVVGSNVLQMETASGVLRVIGFDVQQVYGVFKLV